MITSDIAPIVTKRHATLVARYNYRSYDCQLLSWPVLLPERSDYLAAETNTVSPLLSRYGVTVGL